MSELWKYRANKKLIAKKTDGEQIFGPFYSLHRRDAVRCSGTSGILLIFFRGFFFIHSPFIIFGPDFGQEFFSEPIRRFGPKPLLIDQDSGQTSDHF